MNIFGQLHPRDFLTNLFLGLIFSSIIALYYYGAYGTLPGLGKISGALYISIILFVSYIYGMIVSNAFYARFKKIIRTKSTGKITIALKKYLLGVANKSAFEYPPNSFSNTGFNKKDVLDSCIQKVFPELIFDNGIKYEKISGLVMAFIRENASSTAYLNVERQFQFFNFYSRLLVLCLLFSLLNLIAIIGTLAGYLPYIMLWLVLAQAALYYFTRLSGFKYQQAYSTHRKYSWNLFITLVLTKWKSPNNAIHPTAEVASAPSASGDG